MFCYGSAEGKYPILLHWNGICSTLQQINWLHLTQTLQRAAKCVPAPSQLIVNSLAAVTLIGLKAANDFCLWLHLFCGRKQRDLLHFTYVSPWARSFLIWLVFWLFCFYISLLCFLVGWFCWGFCWLVGWLVFLCFPCFLVFIVTSYLNLGDFGYKVLFITTQS